MELDRCCFVFLSILTLESELLSGKEKVCCFVERSRKSENSWENSDFVILIAFIGMAQAPNNKRGRNKKHGKSKSKSNNKSNWKWTEQQDGTRIGKYGHVYYVSRFNEDSVYTTGTSQCDYLLLSDDGTSPPAYTNPVIMPVASKFGIKTEIRNGKRFWMLGNVMDTTADAVSLWNNHRSILWEKINLFNAQGWVVFFWGQPDPTQDGKQLITHFGNTGFFCDECKKDGTDWNEEPTTVNGNAMIKTVCEKCKE